MIPKILFPMARLLPFDIFSPPHFGAADFFVLCARFFTNQSVCFCAIVRNYAFFKLLFQNCLTFWRKCAIIILQKNSPALSARERIISVGITS